MFSKIIFSNKMSSSNPASIDLNTGVLFLNKKTWFKFNKDLKKQILLHELGHYRLQTDDEFKADDFALKNYMAYGGCEIQAEKALTEILKFDTVEQQKRLKHRIAKIQKLKLQHGY